MLEKDLEIFDVWQAPNDNLFIKVSDEYSLAIGPKGHHVPSATWNDLSRSQYVKRGDITPVIKVGKVLFSSVKKDRKEKLQKIKQLNDEIQEWLCE